MYVNQNNLLLFKPQRQKYTGEWIKFRYEEHYLYLKIYYWYVQIQEVKVGQAFARIGEIKFLYKSLIENLNGTDNLEYICENGRMIFR